MFPRLLLVDDDLLLTKSLRRLLRAKGFGVIVTDRGDEALRLTELEEFDAIVVDAHMPSMSGEDLIRSIRARDPATPIIVLTADDAAMDRCRVAGANDCVSKCGDPRAWVSVIRALAGGEESAQDTA